MSRPSATQSPWAISSRCLSTSALAHARGRPPPRRPPRTPPACGSPSLTSRPSSSTGPALSPGATAGVDRHRARDLAEGAGTRRQRSRPGLQSGERDAAVHRAAVEIRSLEAQLARERASDGRLAGAGGAVDRAPATASRGQGRIRGRQKSVVACTPMTSTPRRGQPGDRAQHRQAIGRRAQRSRRRAGRRCHGRQSRRRSRRCRPRARPGRRRAGDAVGPSRAAPARPARRLALGEAAEQRDERQLVDRAAPPRARRWGPRAPRVRRRDG